MLMLLLAGNTLVVVAEQFEEIEKSRGRKQDLPPVDRPKSPLRKKFLPAIAKL